MYIGNGVVINENGTWRFGTKQDHPEMKGFVDKRIEELERENAHLRSILDT